MGKGGGGRSKKVCRHFEHGASFVFLVFVAFVLPDPPCIAFARGMQNTFVPALGGQYEVDTSH